MGRWNGWRRLAGISLEEGEGVADAVGLGSAELMRRLLTISWRRVAVTPEKFHGTCARSRLLRSRKAVLRLLLPQSASTSSSDTLLRLWLCCAECSDCCDCIVSPFSTGPCFLRTTISSSRLKNEAASFPMPAVTYLYKQFTGFMSCMRFHNNSLMQLYFPMVG